MIRYSIVRRSTDPAQALSDWIEVRLNGARQSMLIRELTETLADDSGALSKIQESQAQMRKRPRTSIVRIIDYAGRVYERAMRFKPLVQGALVEMESPLKLPSSDIDEWIESIIHESLWCC